MSALRPKSLECPSCGAPVGFQAPFCPYCRAEIAWGNTVPLERGARLRACDATREDLPVHDGIPIRGAGRNQEGTLIKLEQNKAFDDQFPVSLCDACIAVVARVDDKNGSVGVVARIHDLGKSTGGYDLMIHPAYRSFRLSRVVLCKERAFREVIRSWEVAPCIGGVGVWNQVELRCADSLFEIVVNGQRVCTLTDARFGYGRFGWRVHGREGPTSAVIRSVELFRVS